MVSAVFMALQPLGVGEGTARGSVELAGAANDQMYEYETEKERTCKRARKALGGYVSKHCTEHSLLNIIRSQMIHNVARFLCDSRISCCQKVQ